MYQGDVSQMNWDGPGNDFNPGYFMVPVDAARQSVQASNCVSLHVFAIPPRMRCMSGTNLSRSTSVVVAVAATVVAILVVPVRRMDGGSAA